MGTKSALEEMFALHIKAHKLPAPVREYRFCERRWRVDFCWPDAKLAVEIEGGAWSAGRHTRGVGFIADMKKYNRLSLLGWVLLRYDGGAVKSGEAIEEVAKFLVGGFDAKKETK